jgi:MFS family permease
MIRAMGQKGLGSRAGVLAERNYRVFYTGYVTSLLGTAMSSVAIAWAVLDSRIGATGLGLVFAASVVAQVLLLAVAGAVADRIGHRRVMVCADVLRCCVQTSLAVALTVGGRPPLWLFVLLTFLEGTGDAFFSPSLGALTLKMSPPDQLGNANTLYGLATSVTSIAGPSLSGVLVAVSSPAAVIATDAATYAVSALALSLLRLPPAPAPASAASASAGASSAAAGRGPQTRRWLLRDIAEGWSDFRSRRWLWVTTLQWALFNLITWAPWMLLGPVQGHAYLGGAAVWGAIRGAQGAGAVVAGLLCLGRRPRYPVALGVAAMFLYAMPDVPMALHSSAVWVGLAAFACGAGSAVAMTFDRSALQQQVPPDRLARVSSLSMFSSYGIGVIGYAIDGPLSGVLGARLVFGIGAVYGMLSTSVVLALPSVRAVRWQDRRLGPRGQGLRAAG